MQKANKGTRQAPTAMHNGEAEGAKMVQLTDESHDPRRQTRSSVRLVLPLAAYRLA